MMLRVAPLTWTLGSACSISAALAPENYTVAVAADVTLATMPQVLTMIARERPDVVVVNGDIGYSDCDRSTPQVFMNMVNDILGRSVPLFLTKGNHDEYGNNWEREKGYSQLLAERWKTAGKDKDFVCNGKWGVNQTCRHNGVAFTFATHGCEACLYGESNYVCDVAPQRCDELCQAGSGFHTSAFAGFPGFWKMCFWHKNMNRLQVGGKPDETGFEPYEECLKAGAMIFTGHEHSYERTRTLTSMAKQTVDTAWSDADRLRVKEGSSFVVVGALGGFDVRPQMRCLPETYPYGCRGEWGKILSASQNGTAAVGPTASIIRLHADGNPCKAIGRLVSTDGQVLDEFEIYSQVAMSAGCCPEVKANVTSHIPVSTATMSSAVASSRMWTMFLMFCIGLFL